MVFSGELDGVVHGHRDGHGFLRPDNGSADVYLAPAEMRAVLHRDRLRVRVVRQDRKGRPEGRVLEILARRTGPIIGRLLNEAGGWLVAPEDKRYGQDILIPKNAVSNAQVGQVVAVELTEPASLYSQPVGRVTEVLGQIDDPGLEIEIAVRKYDVPYRFSSEALAEADRLPDKLRPADRRNRIDLTDVPLVTIDGEDARDFDDAVYCTPHAEGRGRNAFKGWRLLVAIADVGHYVKLGDALDKDALERATSVYFPRRVIPMLPEKLSNGLCSLNPDVDRLSMVCDMLVGEDGSVPAYQFYPAVIRSHARLTYGEVATALGNRLSEEAGRLPGLLPHLHDLHDVFLALFKARQLRGAIEFDSTETQIVCDVNGRIEKIVPRTRNDAHRMIEEAMLAANVCAADFIVSSAHHALFRVHEGPTPEKRQSLLNFLKALGLGLSLSDSPAPAEFQAIARATHDRPDALQIQTMLLRSMQQATYSPENSGHFGLAYSAYAHFTSPIRRYPDLLVHRVIKALLQSKQYHPGGRARSGADELAVWQHLGVHCSANERRADEASKDVEAWLKCRYMRERLGEDFVGTVSAVTSFGLFVTLEALYVEGLVHITELGGEYYRFDELKQELRGERTGLRYAIGSKVRVQVSRVDLDGRRIDFRIVREAEAERLLAKGRVGAKAIKTDLAETELSADQALNEVRETDRGIKRASKGLRKTGRVAAAAELGAKGIQEGFSIRALVKSPRKGGASRKSAKGEG